MNTIFAVVVGVLLLAALLLFSTTYTVRFNEVAVRTTFGKTSTASVQSRPGVHFRYPLFADRVTKYDTRMQLRACGGRRPDQSPRDGGQGIAGALQLR